MRALAVAALAMPALGACASSGASGGSSTDAGDENLPESGAVIGSESGGGCTTRTTFVAPCIVDDGGFGPTAHEAGAQTCADAGLDCALFCGSPVATCQLAVNDAGEPAVQCDQVICGGGRRFEGLGSPPAVTGNALGRLFSRMAYLEAASVVSFEILARELRALGAPDALVAEASRSARDEVRHAKAMTALARRHGGSPPPRLRKRAPKAPRSLLRVARENAIEGRMRETYGALLATYQALEARDPLVRRTLARIARDETAHAALAWKVHAWASTRLTPSARRTIDRARARAFETLLRELEREPAAALVADAGMPRPEQARKLLEGLAALAA